MRREESVSGGHSDLSVTRHEECIVETPTEESVFNGTPAECGWEKGFPDAGNEMT